METKKDYIKAYLTVCSLLTGNRQNISNEKYETCLEACNKLEDLIDKHFNLIEEHKLAENRFDNLLEKMMNIAKLVGVEELDDVYFNVKKLTDNPPLEFNELEPEMWVWDDFHQDYTQIKSIDEEHRWVEFYGFRKSIFKKNQYYRKQVVKDEEGEE